MRTIKAKNGGTINLLEKGETANPNGRPKVPKTIKEFIKTLENEDDEVLIPVEACELITKGGKQYYKLKSSSGHRMAMTAYNKALKGDIRFLDWLTKMGYAGGYEATKQENKNINITPLDIIKELDGDNKR
jgi:hypothetical protein